jgi:hypothetical protein
VPACIEVSKEYVACRFRVEGQVAWKKYFGVGMKEKDTAVRANQLGDGRAETTKENVEKIYV